MTEKIEAGTMVWVRDDLSSGWKEREFIAVNKAGDYLCWDGNHRGACHWDEITTTDPKTPDCIPDGFELWEKYVQGCNVLYKGPDGRGWNNPETTDIFHSFAVKAGDGKVWLMNMPNWFAKQGSDGLWDNCIKSAIPAQILGCIMRKATK